MIKLYDGDITDILPDIFKEKPEVIALGYALKMEIQRVLDYCAYISLYASIATLPENILDALAAELKTQYYDSTLDVETKRGLVKNTLIWYKTAGTLSAVTELITSVFGEGYISEWFSYDGDPFYFKISTDTSLTNDSISYFMTMLQRVKNLRSHIESITMPQTAEANIIGNIGSMTVHIPTSIEMADDALVGSTWFFDGTYYFDGTQYFDGIVV
ncbi:MAG: phage tail protein [Lachnospiraceae bacterium]|nr:phage tail protein [Lachnospiraceae bacterium]